MGPGSVIGKRFTIAALAGRGGMADVYRAQDQTTGAVVALKIFLEKGKKGPATGRFVREADVLERLVHPGVVQHVAHGLEPDGSLFLAMEWLEGEDLESALTRGRLPVDRQRRSSRCACAQALAAAHAVGVVHRDVKPSNVFLRRRTDRPERRCSTSASRVDRRRARASRAPDEALGTPAYMAPEQAKGIQVGRAPTSSRSAACCSSA